MGALKKLEVLRVVESSGMSRKGALERLARVPGVVSVGGASAAPMALT